MKASSSILQVVPFVFGIFTRVSATPLVHGLNTNVCDGAVTLASTWIGEAKNVELKSVFCLLNQRHGHDVQQHVLPVQQQTVPTNVCGAQCATNCFTPAGGGPDPNDCHVIADALRFDSQSIGPLFDIGTGTNITLKYNSCETFFLNQASGPLVYCRTDWASLIDFVAPNCQATQNAHGGNCVANNQAWFVQVNHIWARLQIIGHRLIFVFRMFLCNWIDSHLCPLCSMPSNLLWNPFCNLAWIYFHFFHFATSVLYNTRPERHASRGLSRTSWYQVYQVPGQRSFFHSNCDKTKPTNVSKTNQR